MTKSPNTEARLSRSDLPYTIGMVLLDIAAPICLMSGISLTTAASASLLSNFEIVTMSLIAADFQESDFTETLDSHHPRQRRELPPFPWTEPPEFFSRKARCW